MPLRKRAIPDHHAGGAKRQKLDKEAVKSSKSSAGNTTGDLTALNSTQSPLLRLPAELRNKIWKLAYPDCMIQVKTKRTKANVPYLLRYCRYAVIDGVCLWKPAPAPKLVCKQFWSEVCHTFLSSTTFRFDSVKNFRLLALSEKSIVPRIRSIMFDWFEILSPGSDHIRSWAKSLTSSIVGRFENLEGVTLLLDSDMWEEEGLGKSNIMSDARWMELKLPAIIRSFQQHKLKSSMTAVTVIEWNPPDHSGTLEMEAFINEVKAQLLDYHPRRLSGRGEGK